MQAYHGSGRGQGPGGVQSVLGGYQDSEGPASGGGGEPVSGHTDVVDPGACLQGGADESA